jgi:hypothetical protein
MLVSEERLPLYGFAVGTILVAIIGGVGAMYFLPVVDILLRCAAGGYAFASGVSGICSNLNSPLEPQCAHPAAPRSRVRRRGLATGQARLFTPVQAPSSAPVLSLTCRRRARVILCRCAQLHLLPHIRRVGAGGRLPPAVLHPAAEGSRAGRGEAVRGLPLGEALIRRQGQGEPLARRFSRSRAKSLCVPRSCVRGHISRVGSSSRVSASRECLLVACKRSGLGGRPLRPIFVCSRLQAHLQGTLHQSLCCGC